MKLCLEQKQFIKLYSVVSLVLLVILFLWLGNSVGFSVKSLAYLGCFVVADLVLFFVVHIKLSKLYRELEKMSQEMEDVLENNNTVSVEEYRDGTIGLLYSNFDKMVQSLTESRNREMDEKIFLRDIISDISHQLKTPLASLNIFVDLLLEDKVTDTKERQKILQEASNQLSRMEWMVLSLLKLARIEAGAIQFDMKPCYLQGLFMQAKAAVNYLYENKHQTLHINCPKDTTLCCDSGWLVEALINLLKNASDYTETEKNVYIDVEDSNIYTRILIRDEGCGISEENLSHIFERFYRVAQEVNPNSVGIGLALTKSIIDGMGAMIRVQSELGVGSCFTITFVK